MSLHEQLQHKIDAKAKPTGSLGMLEQIALRAGTIQHTTRPTVSNPHIIVFAADHGIAATGLVNAYPQQITALMVKNYLKGTAAINVFCRQNEIALNVVDAGVNADFGKSEGLIDKSIAHGTANYLHENAMTPEQVEIAMLRGRDVVKKILSESNCNCIGFGEMGIGNSSSAALIMSVVTGLPLEVCVGKGAGASHEQMASKMSTLKQVYLNRGLHERGLSPLEILSRIGGFEIAMMTGGYVQAFINKAMIVVDGFISTSALLLAHQIDPHILDNCFFAHQSDESGHRLMLEFLSVKPILNLGMRLGEGTGAALAIPLIRSAVAFVADMADLEEVVTYETAARPAQFESQA
jgi:nicotinate-nucleotide--dimethylbenzimidazole phosphoribosyltransferase